MIWDRQHRGPPILAYASARHLGGSAQREFDGHHLTLKIKSCDNLGALDRLLDLMARGRKTGGRQKGTRNRAREEARSAAAATGVLPPAYMLAVMRDPTGDEDRICKPIGLSKNDFDR